MQNKTCAAVRAREMAFLLKYSLYEGRNHSTCAPDRSYSDQRHGLAHGRSLPPYTMIKSSCFVRLFDQELVIGMQSQ